MKQDDEGQGDHFCSPDGCTGIANEDGGWGGGVGSMRGEEVWQEEERWTQRWGVDGWMDGWKWRGEEGECFSGFT